jgi:hypothetical protein
MHLQNQKLFVIPREDIFTFIPGNDARIVSTRSHPPIAERVSPVPIRVYMSWVGFGEVKWAQTQNLNDVQHKTGQEMHREVRATLNSIRKLS